MPDPTVWGPHMWNTLHYVALGYPDNPSIIDKNQYADFFMSLHKVIPCITCAKHYQEMVQSLSVVPFLESQSSLFEWTVKIHNLVNKRLGKPEVTVEKALEMLNHPQKQTAKVHGMATTPSKASASKSTPSSESDTRFFYFYASTLLIMLCLIIWVARKR